MKRTCPRATHTHANQPRACQSLHTPSRGVVRLEEVQSQILLSGVGACTSSPTAVVPAHVVPGQQVPQLVRQASPCHHLHNLTRNPSTHTHTHTSSCCVAFNLHRQPPKVRPVLRAAKPKPPEPPEPPAPIKVRPFVPAALLNLNRHLMFMMVCWWVGWYSMHASFASQSEESRKISQIGIIRSARWIS